MTDTPKADKAADSGLRLTTCSSLTRSLEIAQTLEKLHQHVMDVCGDNWPDVVAEQRPLIEVLMEEKGTTNPLHAVLDVVKKIPKHDKSRELILAVAVQIGLDGKNAPVLATADNTTPTP